MGFALPKNALALFAPLLLSACGPINVLTERVDPGVVTLARTQGRIDVSNTCTPPTPPAPPAPERWWDGLPPAQPPKVAGQGVVGFELWRNTTDGCLTFRQDLYRTGFAYALAPLQPLRDLITKAELTFYVAVLPAPRPGSFCQAMTGAGGSLLLLRQGSSLPAGAFAALPPQQPFPDGGQVFAMTFPWVPGALPGGASTSAAGGNRASFTVDVLDRLKAALARGDSTLGFVLSGADETLPAVSPPAGFDCRTYYQIGQLVVIHL